MTKDRKWKFHFVEKYSRPFADLVRRFLVHKTKFAQNWVQDMDRAQLKYKLRKLFFLFPTSLNPLKVVSERGAQKFGRIFKFN